MRSTLALLLAGVVAAQSTPQLNYPYTIDPETVAQSDRDIWCSNQKAQCPLICLQQPSVTSMTTLANDCDPDALTYSCICENNVAPNVTQYSQTLPFYICQQWGNNCVKNCAGDNGCADSCRADHPCGAQSPYKGNTSLPTTSTARPTASGETKIPVTGFGGAQETGANTDTFGGSGTGAAAGLLAPGVGVAVMVLGFAVFL